jgi:hypothetical protein
MGMPKFSVVVPWRGGKPQREPLLRNMLLCLEACNAHSNLATFELVIVEHPDEPGDHFGRVNHIVPETLAGYVYQQLPAGGGFNKSWCMNVGARLATTNRLVFADADSLFGPKFFVVIDHYVRTIPHPRNKLFLCWNYLIGLPGKDNPVSRHIEPHMLNTLGGIWYADKGFFFGTLGGMNENFVGYGGEDNEAYVRAEHIIGPSLSYIAYPLAHQYHDWEQPSGSACDLFEITRDNPGVVCERLKRAGVGKLDRPSFIEMADLK